MQINGFQLIHPLRQLVAPSRTLMQHSLRGLATPVYYCISKTLLLKFNMTNSSQLSSTLPTAFESLQGKKVLFASFPADGHFNPMTGLAVHLKSIGCDVRWYTSPIYAPKLARIGVPHYTFKTAKDVNGENLEEVFPERRKIKGTIAKLRFDMIQAFILRGPEYYADIKDIYEEFPFHIVVADCAFAGIPFIADKLRIPVISIGVMPMLETSKDLPPPGLGMTPSYSFSGRIRQRILRYLADRILFGKPNKVMRQLLEEHGVDHMGLNVFDLIVRKSTLLLQSGTPGFEYYRSDLGNNIRFIGALLPHTSPKVKKPWFDPRLNQYEKIIIVTQGTVERDTGKIIVPVLEAFKGTDTLVIATTGGSGTAELKEKYPQQNLIIEDFIAFGDVMPYADAYITNGGYGGVMLGIANRLPLVVAGMNEGKNEINARIGYFGLGINLRTERPKPQQVRKAVEKVLQDKRYMENVSKLAKEFDGYDPRELGAYYIDFVLKRKVAGS